jgi:hypothetical protein
VIRQQQRPFHLPWRIVRVCSPRPSTWRRRVPRAVPGLLRLVIFASILMMIGPRHPRVEGGRLLNEDYLWKSATEHSGSWVQSSISSFNPMFDCAISYVTFRRTNRHTVTCPRRLYGPLGIAKGPC